MDAGYQSEIPLGYAQAAAGSFDTAHLLSALVTLPDLAKIKLILITPEAQAVRWRDDGTDPTASVGYPLGIGQTLEYTGNQAGLAKLKFIAQSAGAILNCEFYGSGSG